MGVTGGVNAIAGGVAAMTEGFFSNLNVNLPIIFTVFFVFIGTILLSTFKTKGLSNS